MKNAKKWLFSLVFSAFGMSAVANELVIQSNDVASYLNKNVTVCGRVAQVKKTDKLTYINIDGNYPHQNITFIVWASDYPIFHEAFGNFADFTQRQACASGKITKYKERPQIILKDPTNLTFKK